MMSRIRNLFTNLARLADAPPRLKSENFSSLQIRAPRARRLRASFEIGKSGPAILIGPPPSRAEIQSIEEARLRRNLR
jgi:hypothetical protein